MPTGNIGILHRAGQSINNIAMFRSGTGLSRFLDGWEASDSFGRKTVTFLEDTSLAKRKGATGFFQNVFKFLPQGAQSKIAWFVKQFNTLPGLKKLGVGVKWNFMFEAITSVFRTAKDAYDGFTKTQGSFTDRLISGFKSGSKSLAKSGINFAASVAGAFALPTLLGMPLIGTGAVVVGTLGSIVTNLISSNLTNNWLDTHGHTSEVKAKKEEESYIVAQSGEDIVKNIERSLKIKSEPGTINPWLAPDYMRHEEPFPG